MLMEDLKLKLYDVYDVNFEVFGCVKSKKDYQSILKVLDTKPMPAKDNIYVPSDEDLEKCTEFYDFMIQEYGQMPIQIGYCNGYNSTINGVEYHKGSEFILSSQNIILFLGHVKDIVDNEFSVDKGSFFFIPSNTLVELYQTTLHLSPIKTSNEGFKAIIVLPKGTNTDLDVDSTDKLLFKKNKWILAHPERKQLVNQGVHVGLIGENLEIKL